MLDFKGMANKIWSVADLLRGDYKHNGLELTCTVLSCQVVRTGYTSLWIASVMVYFST